MTTPPSLLEQINESLKATYTLERELGGGGMSRVFLADEMALGRRVVVKLLHPDLAAGVSADRFTREVRLAAQLQQANIVPVLSAGEVVGLPYYTMPFITGRSLRMLLDTEQRLSVAQTISIASDVAKALAYAHAQGVVHRDIKPENILLSGGTAVVTDFGIAKAITASRTLAPFETLTQVGTSLGTPAYMAPEQAMGDPTTNHRADIYALGITMYEMLAGGRPFQAPTLHDLVRAHVTQDPEPIATKRPDIPPALAGLVMRCLAKSPDARPASAAELLDALSHASTQTSAPVTVAAAAPSSKSTWRITAFALGLGVLVAAGVIATRYVPSRTAAPAADALDVSRILIAPPIADGGNAALSTLAARATDALTRGLATVAAIRHVETAQAVSDAEALKRARASASGTLLTGSVGSFGKDSARFRFQLVNPRTGDQVRSIAVDVPTSTNDDDLRAALDPVLSTLTIVSNPSMGAATLPLGAPPKFEAARELTTAIDLSFAEDDTLTRASALMHFTRATAIDTGFAGGRLWRAQFIQQRFPVSYFVLSRTISDSVIHDLGPQLARLSSFERAYYDFVVAVHGGRVGDQISTLRRIRAIAPQVPAVASLPQMLLDQNHPREALEILNSLPPGRDRDGRVIPPKDDISRWRYIVAIQHALGDRVRNIEAADELRRLAPDDIGSVRSQLIAAAWDGDSARIAELLTAGRSMPRRLGTYDFFGDVELQVGQELIAHGHRKLGEQLTHDAVAWFESRTPNDIDLLVQFRIALAYHAAQDYKKAAAALAPLLAKSPTSTLYVGLAGRIAAASGDTAEAERRSKELAAMDGRGLLGTHTQERAMIAADLGRKAEAVSLLEQAFGEGIGWNVWWRLHWFNDLQSLRGYEPFERLLKPQG